MMNLLELSQTIRKVRLDRKMTVEQLAVRSGFSKGFISQVENFRITPSLKALEKIAEALDLTVSELFERNSPPEEYSFGNLADGVELQRNDSARFGIRYLALACRQARREMAPFAIEYTPAPRRPLMSHESEEFFLLLEGKVDFCIHDTASPKHLKPGDTVYLKADVPHAVSLSAGCRYAKALVIYSEPAEENPGKAPMRRGRTRRSAG